ncbi:calcium-activated chloride channel regulator family member 3-like [Dermacentor silvarum]|uniref:calcium-activated chloride channel regulator family member 3-like n=1 Tax=Dermacentor silvarum TaxID=543639 RepID=UPI0021006BD5|nr:calcium-activated chloride channel regulator family member 3-like [Dermacentor silvarum]
MFKGAIAVTLGLFCLTTLVSGAIDKSDGGYSDIVVSIHPDVTPSDDIVRNLKALLTSASQFLHIATNGRVYFKRFIIEFPKSWPKRKSPRILGATYYPKSEVRIRNSSFCGDNQPYTVTSKDCGEQGDFMHLPAEYLLSLSPLTTEKKESFAYTFVHEWAHLRYGVFDEYGRRGDPKYPETYCVGNKVKLNACSKNLRFTAERDDGSKCIMDDECNLEEKCIISPYFPAKRPAESSIMFMPYLKNISHFCESGQGLRMHNSEARTTHNLKCNRRSVLDVILSNDDFNKLATPNLSKRIHVTVDEAQQGDEPQKVVVALDTSGSMKRKARINFLKEGLQAYINNVPDGKIRLVMLEFNTNATLLHDVLVVNSTTRKSFVTEVNALATKGRTCIGCALELAIQVT